MNWFRSLLVINSDSAEQRRRGQVIVWMSLVLLVGTMFAVPFILSQPNPSPSFLTLSVISFTVITSIWITRKGFIEASGWLIVIVGTGAITIPTLLRNEINGSFVAFVIPLMVASIILRPRYISIGTIFVLAVMIGLYSWIRPPFDSLAWNITGNAILVVILTGVIGFFSSRTTSTTFKSLEEAQASSATSAAQLQILNNQLEDEVAKRTNDLEQALIEVRERAEVQAELLRKTELQQATIEELSTPTLRVARGTLLMPLVGLLDDQRIVQVQQAGLAAIENSSQPIQLLLLDITGVPFIDEQVAQGLFQLVRAAQLLGTKVVLIGVQPEVAQSLVALGVDWSSIRTMPDVETALYRLANVR